MIKGLGRTIIDGPRDGGLWSRIMGRIDKMSSGQGDAVDGGIPRHMPSVADIDIRSLRIFVELARDLSFTRVANRISIKQSVVSGRLRQLERQIGFRLLNRSTRHVELSVQGRVFLQAAEEVIRSVDQALASAENIRHGVKNRLTIGASPFRTVERWALLTRFLDENRDVDLSISSGDTPSLLAKLRNGLLSLAFTYGPVPPDCRGITLSTHPVGAVFLRQGMPTGCRPLHPIALRDKRVVIIPREIDFGLYGRIVEALNSYGIEPMPLPESTPEASAEIVRRSNAVLITTRWWEGTDDFDDLAFCAIQGIDEALGFGIVAHDQILEGVAERFWQFSSTYIERSFVPS